jgi:hypothetical protein
MYAIAITGPNKLGLVGTKSVDRRLVEHVAAIVREEVDTRFEGNQRRAAKLMPISQTQISDYYSLKPGKGLGLPVLLALRGYFNRTLDDLLGLEPLPSEQLVSQIKASIEAHLAGLTLPRPAKPEKAKAKRVERPGVTEIAPQGETTAAAKANTRSRSSARKQNREAAERQGTTKSPPKGRRSAHSSR